MRSHMPRIALALLFAVAIVGTHALTSEADGDKPAYTPVSNVKNIMNAMNHEEHGLFGMMNSACKSGNVTSDGWKMMRHRAAMLAEAGNILEQLAPPKGEVASWRKHAAAFRDAAKALKKPMIKRKTDQVTAALALVKKQCDACHTAHRPE